MAENNDERQDYEEKLQVILRTCLMYNTSEAMGKAVGYTLHGKGNKGFKGKPLAQLDRIYGWLCTKAREMSKEVVNLDDLLSDYKIVSEYWMSKLRRTYSCDLHKPNEEHFQRNKSLLFALLDYTLDKEAAIKKYAPLFNTDTYKKIAEDFECYSKKIALFEPLILLLMIGLLPKYDSKQTKADNILDDYILYLDFLCEYLQLSVAVKNFRDVIVKKINERAIVAKKIRDEINKSPNKLKKTEENPLNRLFIISETKEYFDQLNDLTNGKDVAKNYRLRHNYSDPEIEGIWTNIEGKCKSTNFWKIKYVGNGAYQAIYYEKKTDVHGNYQLESTIFIWSIINNGLTIVPFERFNALMEYIVSDNDKLSDELTSLYVDFQSVDIGKGKSRIDKIVLDAVLESVAWFPYKVFYRVPEKEDNNDDTENKDTKSDVKLYEEMINELPSVNKTPDNLDYMSTKQTCIVPEFLYIPINLLVVKLKIG